MPDRLQPTKFGQDDLLENTHSSHVQIATFPTGATIITATVEERRSYRIVGHPPSERPFKDVKRANRVLQLGTIAGFVGFIGYALHLKEALTEINSILTQFKNCRNFQDYIHNLSILPQNEVITTVVWFAFVVLPPIGLVAVVLRVLGTSYGRRTESKN